MNRWITGWKEEAVLKGTLQSHDIKTQFQKFPHSNPLALNKHCVKTIVNWNKKVAGKVRNELVFYQYFSVPACNVFHIHQSLD